MESNQRPPGSEPGVTTNSDCPASFPFSRHACVRIVRIELRGQESNLRPPGSKPGITTSSDYPAPSRVPCGNRTRLTGVEARHLCRSVKGTCRRKERESNPQGREARPGSSGVPSPVGLPFRKAAEAGIEPASRRLTVAFPYQHRTHRINSVRTAGFEPAISCSRGTRNTRLSHVLNRQSAQRESNPPRQVGSLEPLPLGQGHML